MTRDAWRAVTLVAVLAATATCFAAVSLHAIEVATGYGLARAQRDARALNRELGAAQQGVASARAPAVLRRTALDLGLRIEFPRLAPEVHGADVRFLRGAASAEASVVARADSR